MAFLIDPEKKNITHVESPASLKEIYRLLSEGDQVVDTVEIVRLVSGDVICVDEEGRYKNTLHRFSVLLTDYKGNAYTLPLVNKSLVLRFENEGGDCERIVAPIISLAQLQEIVEWGRELS